MKYLEVRIEDDPAYLIVIGDLHIGDKAFSKESLKKVKGYIDWVKQRKNARIFLNGDILNCATRNSATSPFDQVLTLKEQIELACQLFAPVKKQVIGAINGNHEMRLTDFTGYDPTISICDRLEIPYLGISALVGFKVGRRPKGSSRNGKNVEGESNQFYLGYFHHTTGGGATVGGKINRVDKMRQLMINADFYCGSHNHMLGAVPVAVPYFDKRLKNIVLLKQILVDCGGYLEWNESYAEAKQLPPMKLGSPRIRLDGKAKDIHISL